MPVRSEDRERAEDTFLKSSLAFSEVVEGIRRDAASALRGIEQKRRSNEAQRDAACQSLLGALAGVEQMVEEGRARIAREHERQCAARKESKSGLKKKLVELRERHALEVQRLQAVEDARAAEELTFFARLKARIATEAAEATLLADLAAAPVSPVFSQLCEEGSSELRGVLALVEAHNQAAAGMGSGSQAPSVSSVGSASSAALASLAVARVHALFSPDAETAFLTQNQHAVRGTGGGGGGGSSINTSIKDGASGAAPTSTGEADTYYAYAMVRLAADAAPLIALRSTLGGDDAPPLTLHASLGRAHRSLALASPSSPSSFSFSSASAASSPSTADDTLFAVMYKVREGPGATRFKDGASPFGFRVTSPHAACPL